MGLQKRTTVKKDRIHKQISTRVYNKNDSKKLSPIANQTTTMIKVRENKTSLGKLTKNDRLLEPQSVCKK